MLYLFIGSYTCVFIWYFMLLLLKHQLKKNIIFTAESLLQSIINKHIVMFYYGFNTCAVHKVIKSSCAFTSRSISDIYHQEV